jgi:hypothetical protein
MSDDELVAAANHVFLAYDECESGSGALNAD